ncbi:alpha/beta fold hydrolase [Erythrobacter rubeus]|uniref:Alpha/beta hydrolase n=1 Tax=Erythrobacter rubeus TaxID=2760803 RepID=A0ABR8KTE4_9SPHN|nr:alpha/beta hydrolase [Erythrobacter rubeus]MBD2842880.1 alpha/beta hydrolase [Erythrobacter rubeus]
MRLLGLTLMGALLAGCSTYAAEDPSLAGGANSMQSAPADPAVDHANALAGGGAPYRHGYTGEGDDRIHYVEAGAGPAVIFVHGFPSFWYVWRDQMEAFRHCRRVIAVDAPGAGLSAKPLIDEAYKVEALAKRLDALIAELAPGEKVTLVGHDWGGALAWSYAQWRPDRLDRLAIFSAPPYNVLLDLLATDPEQRSVSSYMPTLLGIEREQASTDAFAQSFYDLAYKRMVDTGVLSEREGALFREALAREGALYAGIQWYKANIPEFEGQDPASSYWPQAGAKTDIPVLLVRGKDDKTFVKKMADLAAMDTPDLTVVEFEGVGHWTQFQDPEAANASLGKFILSDGEVCQ